MPLGNSPAFCYGNTGIRGFHYFCSMCTVISIWFFQRSEKLVFSIIREKIIVKSLESFISVDSSPSHLLSHD